MFRNQYQSEGISTGIEKLYIALVERTSQSWQGQEIGKLGVNSHFLYSISCSQYSLPHFLLSPSLPLSIPLFHLSLCISQSPSRSLISTQACYTRVQASQGGREGESSGGKWVTDTINSQEQSQPRHYGTQFHKKTVVNEKVKTFFCSYTVTLNLA